MSRTDPPPPSAASDHARSRLPELPENLQANDSGITVRTSQSWKWVSAAQLALSLLAMAAICWQGGFLQGKTQYEFLFFTMLIWHCSAMGFWLGLGRRWWRWPIVVVGGPLLAYFVSLDTGELYEFELFCVAQICVVAATAWGLRLCFGRLRVVTSHCEGVDALQFGIRQIFIWTTAAAVALGVGRVIVGRFDFLGSAIVRSDVTVTVVSLALCCALITVVNIWAMLGKRVTPTKGIVMVSVSIACGYSAAKILDSTFAAAMLGAQAWMWFTLLTLRHQNYRFLRSGESSPT